MKEKETKITTETKVEEIPTIKDEETEAKPEKPEVEKEVNNTSKTIKKIKVSNQETETEVEQDTSLEDRIYVSNKIDKIDNIERFSKSIKLLIIPFFGAIIIALICLIFCIVILSNKRYKAVEDKLNSIASQSDANYNDLNNSIIDLNDKINDQQENIDNINNELDSIDQLIDDEINDIYEKIKEVEEAKAEKKAVELAAAEAARKRAYIASINTTTYTQDESGLTAKKGVNYYSDQKETYYNLNMNGVVNNAHNNGIEGEYWVREDGTKMFGEYVIVAANQDVHPYGTTVDTSLGTGIVLDTGGFAANNPTQVDIATTW